MADVFPSTGAGATGRLAFPVERIRGGLLWLTAFSGSFVFMEPSPYELATLLTMTTFLVTGLSVRASAMPLVLLLLLSNIGFSIAVIPLADTAKPVIWVLVSWYMCATCVFYTLALGENTEARISLLLRGYTAGAVVCSLLGVLAYFHLLPGTDLFLKYGRVRATFNDPNVLGAFLVLPALWTLSRVLAGNFREAARASVSFLIIALGILLSFSRAAWGQLAAAAVIMMLIMLVTTSSGRQRLRIIGLAVLGALAFALFIAALLSIDQVAALFKERASFDQNYDSGHFGRFGRHVLGFMAALDSPLGLGPLQFGKIFPEDPHNTYLNEFMSGGWLSGLSYLALIVISIALGWRYLGVRTPWQRMYIVIYSGFLGNVGESAIIDTDHWRHFYLLLGGLWGLAAATRAYRARLAAPTQWPPWAASPLALPSPARAP